MQVVIAKDTQYLSDKYRDEMRVLAIYPGMDKRYNDNAYALTKLKQMGVELVVITSRRAELKSKKLGHDFENMDGVLIYRLFENFEEQNKHPFRKYHQVKEIAEQLKPDLIFCSQQLNMPLARRLRKDFSIPIVLLVEFAWNPILLLGRRRSYLGIKHLAKPLAKLYWFWLSSNSNAIITCNPADRHHLKALSLSGTPVYYVGWCNERPEGIYPGIRAKDINRAIYVGSLQKNSFKNSEELLKIIPLIFQNTPTKEFVVVGNGALAGSFEKLENQWCGQLRYIKELTRSEVWELIASSFYAYSPVKFGGWGFIGDAWSARTPLVVTHNGYEFSDRVDAVIGDSRRIEDAINNLYKDEELYITVQEQGERRYSQFHTAEQVAKEYYTIFNKCI